MTQLQKKALELVDELLISVHNKALNITDDAEIAEVATKGYDLAKEIHEIQMWCRVINSDPQVK
ncbi:MAG: hypothetical protein ACUZ8H_11385 [Candidatus Anammoxibacter sp.]